MRNKIFEEDRLLAKAAGTPSEDKPRFDWAEALGDNRFEIPKVRITDGAGDRDFHIAEVAEVIGEALTNLMISREENEIYTPKNRELVVESSRIVADRLIERMAEEDEGGAPRLSFDELYRLIEKALVENDAYDVAKSLVISRSNDGNARPSCPFSLTPNQPSIWPGRLRGRPCPLVKRSSISRMCRISCRMN
jgi:ribonucleoside-diphosphate reductase alpha chain